MASEQELASLAARMGIEYPLPHGSADRIARAVRAARSDTSSTGAPSSAENTPMPMRSRPHHGGGGGDELMTAPPAFDDSASLADSDLDITEKGLHKALAQCQAENRQLRRQIATLHDREV